MTCIVVGLLVWGGQTAGGAAGGLMDSWANLGKETGRREESEGMRETEG